MSTRKVVLITGVSDPNSIGAALSLTFLAENYRVFGTCKPDELDLASGLAQKGCEILPLELGDVRSVEGLANELEDRTGGVLDVLINNAAHLDRAPLLTQPFESITANLMINIAGPMRLTQLVAPMLIRTARLQGRSRSVIINVSTAGSGVPVPLFGFQLGTKAANATLSEVLRHEIAPFNVSVYCAKIGYVKTSTSHGELNPFDTLSPNAQLYADALPQMTARGKEILHAGLEGGTPPDEVARWMLGLCEEESGGGVVWFARRAWLIRWIFPLLPSWLYDRAVLRGGLLDFVKVPDGEGRVKLD